MRSLTSSNSKRQNSCFVGLITALVAALLPMLPTIRAQSPAIPKITQKTFKNIQVLKDLPADDLIPAMQFITASLGVECEFCHVRNAFEKDDKQTKQTARKMMQMVSAINQQNFKDQRDVTCYSCHRGSPRPLQTPVVGDTAAYLETPEGASSTSADANSTTALPGAQEVVDKYSAALGGVEAIGKISSRLETGTARFMSGPAFALKIVSKTPTKQIMTVHLPTGDSSTAFNGRAGWLASPGGPGREMHEADFEGARLDADLQFAVHLKRAFTQLKVVKTEKIGERQTLMLLAGNPGQAPLELFFDKDSGLLARQLRFGKSPLGLNPTRIDYDDYKEFDGVKVPTHLTIARPRTQLDIQIDKVQQNVPVDDTQFEPPAAATMVKP
jgi:photosynthetic reaction center cytochrome c subunit